VQIINNKALLLRVKHPERITSVIPRSQQLNDNDVLVKWGLEEAQILKNLQFKNVPSPILGEYGWSGMYTPFTHQKTTSAFLTLHRRAFCFNEQGTGKTASVIWAADYLMNTNRIKRVLVVCPLSIMQPAWGNDLFKTAMHRTCAIAHSHSKDKRIAAVQSGAEFVICNFDGLAVIKDEIIAANFDLIVVDECTAYKSSTTKRWKTLASIIKPDTWVWMLTGTPAAQSPTDAYGLAKIVNPKGVPKFFGEFRDRLMFKISTFKWIPKPNAAAMVHATLQPAIRFTKDECLDLPPMLYTDRDVPLTPQQIKYYEAIRKKMVAVAAGEEISTVNAAGLLNKLLQLSSGAVYTDTGETVEFDSSNRMTALLEVIEEASQKVIIFAPYRHSIDIISEKLTAAGIPTEVIHGGVNVNVRTEIFRRFQTTDTPKVLVIQPQAAAHGITLHAANVVVWWGPVMSIETYLQANARVHRAGQHHPCTVVHLQGSPVEKHIYKMLAQKLDVHTKLIDLYANVADEAA
jgi:SNF2 family DNA or RNA helicase